MTRVNKQAKEYFAKKGRVEERERLGRDMLTSLVLPYMPRTLEDCYEVNYLYFGYNLPPNQLRIDFSRRPEAKMDLAYGTVGKVQAGLDIRGGWTIAGAPAAMLMYSESEKVQVVLKATKEVEIPHSMMDAVKGILFRRPLPTTMVALELRFENLEPTNSCRLVEVEEWVEEKPSVPAHMETKNKLVCDEEEDGDNNADVG